MSNMKCPNIKTYTCSDGFVTDNEQVAKSHEINIKNKKLLCPFCGEPLCQTYSFNPTQFWCSNYHDPKHPINVQGTKDLWQELIRTRKALDVAVDALCYYASENSWDETNRWMFVENGFEFARDVLVKIDKALEQKDVK